MTDMKHALHCLILLTVLAAAAAEEEPRWTVGTAEQLQQAATNRTGSNATVPVTRLSKPPLIGGAAQEWHAAVPLATFPLAALRASRATEMRFACDDKALYLSANVTDETPLVNSHPANSGPDLLAGDALRIGFDAGRPTVVTVAW